MTPAAAESHVGWVCQQLSLQATRYFDQRDFERAAALFTENGEFVRPSTYPGAALKGRAGIIAFGATLPKGWSAGFGGV
ncbi:MAG TPA: nuclear transport factor 2 family protein [Burkholderiaceae bacterium]|nr:nuclear transport factor 2 family protein [Burkholderiaceae bacterium]